MKKCKACGSKTENKTYQGDHNPFNEENCMQCAAILYHVMLFEEVLNRPTIQGYRRVVSLSAKIRKPIF